MTTDGCDGVAESPGAPLRDRARAHLRGIAAHGSPITYKALAEALALAPPNTIHQATEALEASMTEDAANGHPFIAALVIARARGGLPAPGFFACARLLGRYDGEAVGAEAEAFHAHELSAALRFWGGGETPAMEPSG